MGLVKGKAQPYNYRQPEDAIAGAAANAAAGKVAEMATK